MIIVFDTLWRLIMEIEIAFCLIYVSRLFVVGMYGMSSSMYFGHGLAGWRSYYEYTTYVYIFESKMDGKPAIGLLCII